MKKFYIYDENGKYFSVDGQQRFTLLSGKALFIYLKTPEGKKKHFDIEIDDNGDEIGVEIPPCEIKNHLVAKRHDQYLRDCEDESEITVVSFSAGMTDEGEELFGEETIADDEDVQAVVLKKMNLDTLRYALTQLNLEEKALINAMFLNEKTLSVREYAKELGIGVMTVCDRKNAILRKLKKFF